MTICAMKNWKLVGSHLPNPSVITLWIAMAGNILPVIVKERGVFAMQTITGMVNL